MLKYDYKYHPADEEAYQSLMDSLGPSLGRSTFKKQKQGAKKMEKKGTVSMFNEGKGFGFIKGEDGISYFIHHSGINMDGFRKLEKGQTVGFDVEQSEKGPRAVNVTVIVEG